MDLAKRLCWSLQKVRSKKEFEEACENSDIYNDLKAMSENMLEELEYLSHSHELLYGTVTLLESNGQLPKGWIDRIKEHVSD